MCIRDSVRFRQALWQQLPNPLRRGHRRLLPGQEKRRYMYIPHNNLSGKGGTGMLQQPLFGEGKGYGPARLHGAAHHLTAVRLNPRRKIHRQHWYGARIDGLNYPRRQSLHRPVQPLSLIHI